MCDIYKNISKTGQKVQQISGNGLCLVEAVQVTIDKDLGIKNSYNAQAKKIWAEMKNRILFYQDFTPVQSTTSIWKTIYNYLKKKGSYTMPVIDIKYDMDDVPPHYVMCNAKKSDQYSPFKQYLSLFDNLVTKVVGTSPFNIDGNKIYQIKCDKYTWKEKLCNGRHWQVNWGKNR